MDRRVCIGIAVQAEPEHLSATLDAVRANTSVAADLVILGDGPDAPTPVALVKLDDITQWSEPNRRGYAACFNRLVGGTSADVIVFLESGSLPAPGWLEHLLAALDADPRNGLAGPSTNRSWNEQGAFPAAGSTPEAIAATATVAVKRFGKAARPLAPLHSLGEFCYAVRRSVVEAIGAADEAYADGPCWEMDYNIRAARAGFRGVWAVASYVHRLPWSDRRKGAESRLFEASKHRYQDKFCALRLRGERTDYENHCRGDACEHFAPSDLIDIRRPFARLAPAATPSRIAPLVTCVLPTRGRTEFLLQAIRYFERQDYPHRELIVLDEEEDRSALLPADPRIRYERLAPGLSIGAKRNRGCALARGSIIAQWDDDDWYGPDRLSVQLAPILDGQADITALADTVFFDLPRWTFWRCSAALHARLFMRDVHGGTLVFQRRLWQQIAQYPNVSLAEDAHLLRRVTDAGARLVKVPAAGHFLYLRHDRNAWRFACGSYLDPAGWETTTEPDMPVEDRVFYRARAKALGTILESGQPAHQAHRPLAGAAQPLVSCIMPTADRRRFAERAIRYFERQTYSNRELVIVDDGKSPIGDLAVGKPDVRYTRLERRATIGAKRNLACEMARGEIIAHWDDDDWYSPDRLRLQSQALVQTPGGICGVREILYYDPSQHRAFLYSYPVSQPPWLAGNTLCYAAEIWRRQKFREIDVGEDALFVAGSQPNAIVALSDFGFVVATIHPRNSNPKITSGAWWKSHPISELETLLGGDWSDYTELTA